MQQFTRQTAEQSASQQRVQNDCNAYTVQQMPKSGCNLPPATRHPPPVEKTCRCSKGLWLFLASKSHRTHTRALHKISSKLWLRSEISLSSLTTKIYSLTIRLHHLKLSAKSSKTRRKSRIQLLKLTLEGWSPIATEKHDHHTMLRFWSKKSRIIT